MSYLENAPVKLRTTDIDQARAHLCDALASHDVRYDLGAGRLDFEHRRADWGGMSLHRVRYGAPVSLNVDALRGCYLLQLTLEGRTVARCGRREVATEQGALAMVNVDHPLAKRWETGAEQFMLRIDRRLVERGVGVAMGDNTPRSVAFETDPVTARQAPTLFGLIDLICGSLELENSRNPRPRLVMSLANSLVQLIIHEMPSDRSEALARAVSPACPGYVRRAERFIEECAEQPISVGEIAAHCGVTPRTLSAGFRRFRNISPMERLRALRLDRARSELMTGDLRVSVTSVAQGCGLSHLGRFASDYARRFGESPSETLRRARHAQ